MKTLILIFVLIISTCLFSTIINVPADQPTIQAGIVAAADTDTVLVADGTYYENINFIGKAITVASNFLIDADTLHIENTIINGSQPVNPDFGSVVTFISEEDTTSVLTGFTLTEGTGNFSGGLVVGGGIQCANSSPKIISNIVTNNSAEFNGGIQIDESRPILLNNVISYNTASVNVGGVGIVFGSNPYLEGNLISNNTAIGNYGGMVILSSSATLVSNIIMYNNSEYIGGICISNSSPILLNNVISYNTAAINGGGVSIESSSDPYLEGNLISNNSAINVTGGLLIWSYSSPTLVNNIITENSSPGGCGGVSIESYCSPAFLNNVISYNTAGTFCGGIFINLNSNVNLSDTSIYGNSAGSYGGGIFINQDSSVDVSYTSIYGNSAGIDGGGIEIWSSTPTITNCTIYDNEASGYGSQIDCWSGETTVDNSIIGGNTTNESVYFGTSSVETFDYCDFYNSSTGGNFDGDVPVGLGEVVDTNANGDPCDEFMNILLDPLFVDCVNGDFHLTENSPCIDAGDPTFPPDPDGTVADMGRYCMLCSPNNISVDEYTGLFTWESPLGDDLIGYDVYLDDVFQDNTTATEWQFTGLLNGQEYTAGVAAVYDEGLSNVVTIEFTYMGTAAGNNLVSATELLGNYPNPFNPTTTINYSLKENSMISLSIYNIKGQKVKQLVRDQISTGQHSVSWNGKDDTGNSVSSGIYFYKMKAGKHQKTRKMILMK